MRATLSYAGRVERVKPQPIPARSGGFGGIDGLAQYLQDNDISHVIDATHPFAAQISGNAIAATARIGIPYCAFTRPAWKPEKQDHWHMVPSIQAAVEWLDRPALRIMLAIGRLNLPAFECHPQHYYVLRLVDPPKTAPQFPQYHIVYARGPFTVEADRILLEEQKIDVVITKNAGGDGARAKLDAARELGIQVVMIDRPVYPERIEFTSIDAVMNWVQNEG